MAENEKEEVVLGTQVMEISPTSLGLGRYDREDGVREMFLIPTPSIGLTIPVWEKREDMVSMWSAMYPDRDPSRLTFVMVESPDALISFAGVNKLTIIINPRILDNGTLQYGRIAWD